MIFAAFIIGAALAGFLGGNLLGRFFKNIFRRYALVLLAVSPFLLWMLMGAIDGCIINGVGEKCFAFGFGLILFSPVMAIWAISSVAGYAFVERNKPSP